MEPPDDGMALGWNVPAPATKEEVIETLEDALAAIREDDSFEGFIQWVMPTDESWLADSEFGLMARYRIGNSMGQGGLRTFTKERNPTSPSTPEGGRNE